VRRKPKSKKVRQSERALGAGVEDRPEAAEAREESGHWEIGSAAGKKSDKSAVPAIVERKARIQIAAELGGRDSGAADAAAGRVAGSFGEAAGGAFKSAAGDNGRSSRGGAAPWSAPSISAIPALASRRGRTSATAGFRAASRKRGEARAACPRS
ncbi:MAG: hypothetical protein LBU32_29030, partial [Clostridiales bacterium]|nr:hypothetical protein [Clostridiales bacterium]